MAEIRGIEVTTKRRYFTGAERSVLEEVFARSKFPQVEVRGQLAAQLGVDETKITVWFQNRRHTLAASLNNVTDGVVATNATTATDGVVATNKSQIVRPRKPRNRIMFSDEQLQSLYAEFEKGHFPSPVRRKILSEELLITQHSIKYWFQNMRQALRRKKITFQEYINNKQKSKPRKSCPGCIDHLGSEPNLPVPFGSQPAICDVEPNSQPPSTSNFQWNSLATGKWKYEHNGNAFCNEEPTTIAGTCNCNCACPCNNACCNYNFNNPGCYCDIVEQRKHP